MRVFLKAQLSAFIGGLCDYAIMIWLTQYVHIFYAYSIIISGLCGAVINFSINRYWTFNWQKTNNLHQVLKFMVVVAGSVLLKSYGTYVLVKITGADYKICRLCVDAVVTFGFNFTLQRYWVFQ
jgi:putative flippase GtrA